LENNENQIIRGLKTGDESSYSKLFHKYYVVLVVFATRYVKDMEIAKEIIQDFFVHLFEIHDSLIINTSLRSFLFQSIKNRCLNHIKHIQIHEKHIGNLETNQESNPGIEDKIGEAELEIQIFKHIKKLPPKCKDIFEMSRFEGKKNLEIAENLNISKRTVETQISKALKILRDNLKEYLRS